MANQEIANKISKIEKAVNDDGNRLSNLVDEVKDKLFPSLYMDAKGLFNWSSVEDIKAEIKSYEDFCNEMKAIK